MPETAYYYPYLNIYELLSFYGGLCGMPSALIRQRTEELIVATGLENAGNRLLKTYSKGMLQRAGIAQAILHDPDLLILDEPFTGLDPLARIHLRDLILGQKAKGKTILFSSHELSEAELMCDRIAIINALKSAAFPWEVWSQALLLHAGFIILVTSLALLGSLFVHSDANLSILGILIVGMLLYGQQLPVLAAEQPLPLGVLLNALYWIAPHCEFFDMRTRLVHHWPSISWLICCSAFFYAVAYSSICFVIAAWIFKRKKI